MPVTGNKPLFTQSVTQAFLAQESANDSPTGINRNKS